MYVPNRMPAGISTNTTKGILGFIGLPDPTPYTTYWNDFVDFNSADWTATVVGTGTSALSSALPGGNLVVTNSAANGDTVAMQLKGNSFQWKSSKRMAFKARLKVDSVVNSALVVGLIETTATLSNPANGFYFLAGPGTSTMTASTKAAGTASTITVTGVPNNQQIANTLVDNTYFTVGMRYVSRLNSIDYFLNDIQVGSTPLTNASPTAMLTPSFGVINGTAAARTMTVDYVMAMLER